MTTHWKYDMVTERQWVAIRAIERNLGVKFKGRNKGHASAFIGEHIEESKRVAERRRVELIMDEIYEHMEDFY